MLSPRDFDRRRPAARTVATAACRCAELRAAFGAGAPERCGPCELAAAYQQKLFDGWHPIPEQHRVAYRDCAIEVTATADGAWWAPCWAVQILDPLLATWTAGPVLTRAAYDLEFRDACLTIVTTETEGDIGAKLQAFAESQGVVIERPTEAAR